MDKYLFKHDKKYRNYYIKFAVARFFRLSYLRTWNYFARHRIIRTLTILFIALLVANVVKDHIKKDAALDLTGDLAVGDYDEYLNTLKDVPSDIDGMSQYDKQAMGLDYRDGSDTDHDGLTDKEEIEVYGTDPLKSSTAGDLYTDGYKVANGMDPTASKQYEKDRKFEFNECPEITLEAKSATDFNATVQDCSDRYELDNWGIEEVYKGYFLSNFSGDLTIDISELLLDKGIDTSDISVWAYQGAFLAYGFADLEECKFTEDDRSITLNKEFEPDYSYYIFITPKKSLINSLFKTNETDAIQIGTKTSSIHYLIVDFFNNITIYYPDQGSDEANEKLIRGIGKKYNGPAISYESSTENKMQAQYKAYSTAVPFMKNDFSVKYKPEGFIDLIQLLPKVIFSYQLCYYTDVPSINADADGAGSGDDDVRYAYNNYHTSFDPYEDALPFQNFASKHSEGNCAGISYLTCCLYNKGSFPSSGSYGDISWDLSEDIYNATLMDKGLFDYKTKDFVDKKGGKDGYLGDGLTIGEREFVDMIGAYWTQTNDTFDLNKYKIRNKDGLSWDVAEAMMNRLDQGKIFTASFLLADGTGHEVVLYDYYWITDDEMLFRVYDSNIPMSNTDLSTLNCDGACYLQCRKVANGDGTYNFKYFYWPVKGNLMYCASSDPAQTPNSAIIISDETWQIYN